ncbi:MAG TPA: hypothetical protein VIU82_21945 [Bosea sp. (in: a-proteobacteria)]
MPRPATRDRKERFVQSFGDGFGAQAVAAMVRRHGLAWLTNDQVDEIVSDTIDAAKSRARSVIRNRRIIRRALR